MATSETAKSGDLRPRIVGADTGPEAPFPLHMEGTVISGFGRGSKELGIPTANLPVDSAVTPWIEDAKSGVYFGYASLALPAGHPDLSSSATTGDTTAFQTYPMVMSIGYNPFYKNTVRSAEVHVLHRFRADFYSAPMRLLLLGYVRDELDYSGLEALIKDINIDCEVARNSLAREAWRPKEGVLVVREGEGEGSGEVGRGEVVVETGSLDGSWLVRPLEA
ncbi:riboflavin kinase [Microdochium trichocladiopsis]|uniref:Riboflavin kinase n=1 Tax=Microdochium trichocladiopsis TaxID=1682393 RepID=A0A9P8Y1A9_9PEZI|nr:riboflavin kinase [Microdochium trichocladiopsis]KAH7028063.1 riboflavin kinase [Microdochium trichocladiopsis]